MVNEVVVHEENNWGEFRLLYDRLLSTSLKSVHPNRTEVSINAIIVSDDVIFYSIELQNVFFSRHVFLSVLGGSCILKCFLSECLMLMQ